MAEAEDVLTDVARHVTVFVQDLWRRHRVAPDVPATVALADVARRLDLLITAIFGAALPMRHAQIPARATFLSVLLRHHRRPRVQNPIPATDGASLWLPPDSLTTDVQHAATLYRVMAMQQVMRARRGSAQSAPAAAENPLLADVYLLLEAYAADRDLIALLPGMVGSVDLLRREALAKRPPLTAFPEPRRPLESFVRTLLESPSGQTDTRVPITDNPAQSVALARHLIHEMRLLPDRALQKRLGPNPLLKDWWTGELRRFPAGNDSVTATQASEGEPGPTESPRSAHMPRRPEERKPGEDEDRAEDPGIWMIQAEESHQHAEDPMGLQRPTDRDDRTGAEEFGDMVSELSEARLVSTPGQPKEVLLSDDPPDVQTRQELKAAISEGSGIVYPEWDYRTNTYREPGATVRLLSTQRGSQRWVDDTLRQHQSMLNAIRQRFEMLRAQRVRQRRQTDGDEIDLDAYIDSYADFRAGLPLSDGLYQIHRIAERNMAITLLIDISGSTDSWVSANRRIVDVEREALLLVCAALDSLGEPYAVQAFSGEGPNAVTVRQIKTFREPNSNAVALRISALEPEHYTRAGAAIRHASAGLMQQPADHRLLLLLSDGKPSDKDEYEGRYGVEDTRQAVTEAHLQGIFPFCLTIDRQAAAYLPRIFGAGRYALLPKPELLAPVLLDWMKRLLKP